MSAIATRDAILKAEDLPRETIIVPEWGGLAVTVRALTGAEHDSYTASSMDVSDGKTVRFIQENQKARFLVRCIVDHDGRRLFSDEDAQELGNKSSVAIDRLYEVARQLNGIGGKAEADLRGNSGGGPDGALPSDSPNSSASPASISSSGA